MIHKFHFYWRKMTTKEARLCFVDSPDEGIPDAIADDLNTFIAGEVQPKDVTTLRGFITENKDAMYLGKYSLSTMIQHLLSKKLAVHTSNTDRLAYLKSVINSIKKTDEEQKITGELNQTSLDDFIDIADGLGIPVSIESQKNAEEARRVPTPGEPPPPKSSKEEHTRSAINRSIEKIQKDGIWHPATLPEEISLGLQYCIMQESNTIYRCDTSGTWSEKWNGSIWEFSTEYKKGGRAAWEEHNAYIDGEHLRKQNATVTGVRRYGSERLKTNNTDRPQRKYYIKLNQPYADYIADPDEKEKYLAIPRDGMWHDYNNLDFRQGYTKDPNMVHWQYKLHTDGFMYARRPVRQQGNPQWGNNGRLTWQVMGYSWNADGSAQWITPPQETVSRVLNQTMDMSPQPINDRWAQFNRNKMRKEGYYQ